MMRITEGNLVLTAPAGMAGSFLRLGEQRVPGAGVGGSGREAWQEEMEEERRSRRCCSADRLRLMPAGWHWHSGSDRVVKRAWGLGERSGTGLEVRAATSSGRDGGEVGN